MSMFKYFNFGRIWLKRNQFRDSPHLTSAVYYYVVCSHCSLKLLLASVSVKNKFQKYFCSLLCGPN